MDYEHFTLKMQDALQNASALAQKNDHSEIGLEHLLFSLLEQQDGIIPPIIERIGCDLKSIKNQVQSLLSSNPKLNLFLYMSKSSYLIPIHLYIIFHRLF